MATGTDVRSTTTRGAGWWCAWGFIAISALHVVYGLVEYGSEAGDVLSHGLGGASGDVDRERFFWYMLGGPAMLLAGLWARQEFLRTGRVPRAVAWFAAFLGAMVLLMPDGGFWFFIPLAVLAFRASSGRSAGKRAERDK